MASEQLYSVHIAAHSIIIFIHLLCFVFETKNKDLVLWQITNWIMCIYYFYLFYWCRIYISTFICIYNVYAVDAAWLAMNSVHEHINTACKPTGIPYRSNVPIEGTRNTWELEASILVERRIHSTGFGCTGRLHYHFFDIWTDFVLIGGDNSNTWPFSGMYRLYWWDAGAYHTHYWSIYWISRVT